MFIYFHRVCIRINLFFSFSALSRTLVGWLTGRLCINAYVTRMLATQHKWLFNSNIYLSFLYHRFMEIVNKYTSKALWRCMNMAQQHPHRHTPFHYIRFISGCFSLSTWRKENRSHFWLLSAFRLPSEVAQHHCRSHCHKYNCHCCRLSVVTPKVTHGWVCVCVCDAIAIFSQMT